MLTLLTVVANLAMAVSLTSSSSTPTPSPSRSHTHPNTNTASSVLDAVPDLVWDKAAESLLETGVATVRLSPIIDGGSGRTTPITTNPNEIHSRAFRSARRVLDRALYPDPCGGCGSSGDTRGGGETETKIHPDDDDVHVDDPSCPLLPMIPPDADSAHVTGFHRAGGMSRYNVQREGIVFSDEGCACNCNCNGNGSGCRDNDNDDDDDCNSKKAEGSCYLSDLSEMFGSLQGIADRVLLAIERKLELPKPQPPPQPQPETTEESSGSLSIGKGWFQQHLGPTETASQWHMKRFVTLEDHHRVLSNGSDTHNNTAETILSSPSSSPPPVVMRTETGERITLPMHTDPSLISVVIHDSDSDCGGDNVNGDGNHTNAASSERPGALGLQYFHPREQTWREPEAHGHSVATVFAGSVLAYLTSGHFPAAKHRVVEQIDGGYNDNNNNNNNNYGDGDDNNQQQLQSSMQRMAATLFVRPQPSALLQVPLPSPWLLRKIEQKEQQQEQLQQREKDGNDESSIGTNDAKIRKKKKSSSSSSKPPITFDAWLKRVARNYEKQKRKQKIKTKTKP